MCTNERSLRVEPGLDELPELVEDPGAAHDHRRDQRDLQVDREGLEGPGREQARGLARGAELVAERVDEQGEERLARATRAVMRIGRIPTIARMTRRRNSSR
jgi:hypothetical protein